MTWRCSRCGINWPHYHEFMECHGCGEKCSSMNETPMPVDQARVLEREFREDRKAAEARTKKRADFEKYYEEREVKRLREALDAAKLC